MVTHQLQVERRTAKARRPKTDVLLLDHATSGTHWGFCPPEPDELLPFRTPVNHANTQGLSRDCKAQAPKSEAQRAKSGTRGSWSGALKQQAPSYHAWAAEHCKLSEGSGAVTQPPNAFHALFYSQDDLSQHFYIVYYSTEMLQNFPHLKSPPQV